MTRKKSLKIAEAEFLSNVFPFGKVEIESGISEFFGNDNPLYLEIGCGDADYSRTLALKYPDRNFIGIDVRSARIWNASKKAESENLFNAAFIIARAEFIAEMFPTFKFNEIWLPFPDPFPKRRSRARRLISPGFLERYKKIAAEDAVINLKTDDEGLYEYACETLAGDDIHILKNYKDLYAENDISDEESIKTKYEKRHLKMGKTIKFISFKFDI